MEEKGECRVTEYKVQMFRYGKWQIGSIPFVGHIPVTENIETAMQSIEKAKNAWGKMERVAPNFKTERDAPTEWRILSRTVTPWVECE